ncbi:MAG: MBOAT family protein [Actinomycetia bacterium]|nr:MBOAT family protein [Actinomycetes bacterium]
MVFNSLQYAVFLPFVVLLHWALPARFRLALIVFASYVFYGSWDWRFLSLLVISTLVDFTVGDRLHREVSHDKRRLWLLLSIVVNLGILGAFKYSNFFVDSAVDLLNGAGLGPNEPLLRVILPVGISFYTFQTLSYTIDIYRGRIEPTKSLITFAAYVAYFPQLVAGPIERAQRLLPQLEAERHSPDLARVQSGVGLILLGLVKKVVLADTMAPLVQTAFTDPDSQGSVALAVGVLAFAVQIYGDFSGYSDIARGSSRLLGIELVVNFRQPYLSENITDFWRRWHISLSDWLRDYLYIPLGGNRGGQVRTYRNLMLTMLIGGLWHGASWNFALWGGLHGGYLAVHRLLRDRVPAREHPPMATRVGAWAFTFALVNLAWVFFRADSFDQAFSVVSGLLAVRGGMPPIEDLILVLFGLGGTALIDLILQSRLDLPREAVRHPIGAGVGVGLGLVGLVLFSGSTVVPFIYFQF